MKKYICALMFALSLPLSATMPVGHFMAQASFAPSSICGALFAAVSADFNNKAVLSKGGLEKALRAIKCASTNCTSLVEKDLNALVLMTQAQSSARLASGMPTLAGSFLFLMLLEPRVGKTYPKSVNLFTALPIVVWTFGLGNSIAAVAYATKTLPGINSEAYRPYLDSVEFAALQAETARANSDAISAWTWSAAFFAVQIGSLFLFYPLAAVAHHRCFSGGVEEEFMIQS